MFRNKPKNFAFRVKRITEYDGNDEPVYGYIENTGDPIVFVGNRTNAYGSEVYEAASIGAVESATITVGYHPLIVADCLLCSLEGTVYEIIGTPDNIQQKNKWLQFKIKRYQNG